VEVDVRRTDDPNVCYVAVVLKQHNMPVVLELHVSVCYAVEFESFLQLHTFKMQAKLLTFTGPWALALNACASRRTWEISESCDFYALVKGIQALLPKEADTSSWQPHISFPAPPV
jgi:hypothetical protein